MYYLERKGEQESIQTCHELAAMRLGLPVDITIKEFVKKRKLNLISDADYKNSMRLLLVQMYILYKQKEDWQRGRSAH